MPTGQSLITLGDYENGSDTLGDSFTEAIKAKVVFKQANCAVGMHHREIIEIPKA